jgi:ElaB/YqjD/DUF883 family membrane-anchored ribosome-binding protein
MVDKVPNEVIPNPDPSQITSMAIDRAVENSTRVVGVRLDGMQKAVDVFQADLTRVPTTLDRAVGGLRELLESQIEVLSSITTERFKGVAAQFDERDTRTDQRAGDTKLAVDAAFAAAKEATGKIEAGFTKSIDNLQELMNTNAKASDDKISDLKDRITAIESRTQGIVAANQESREGRTENWGQIAGVSFVVAAIVSVVTFLIEHGH